MQVNSSVRGPLCDRGHSIRPTGGRRRSFDALSFYCWGSFLLSALVGLYEGSSARRAPLCAASSMRRRVALGLQLIARVVSLTGPVVASLDDRMWFDPELPSMAARRADPGEDPAAGSIRADVPGWGRARSAHPVAASLDGGGKRALGGLCARGRRLFARRGRGGTVRAPAHHAPSRPVSRRISSSTARMAGRAIRCICP